MKSLHGAGCHQLHAMSTPGRLKNKLGRSWLHLWMFLFSPHGWVSSLAVESHNMIWQLPEGMSPSAPSRDPAREEWWCPPCCLRAGVKNRFKFAGQPKSRICNHQRVALTPCVLHFFDAEFSCGHCSRVMSRGIICKQEVTPSKNGANTLLRCFTDLKGKWKYDFFYSLVNRGSDYLCWYLWQTFGLLCTVKLRRPW